MRGVVTAALAATFALAGSASASAPQDTAVPRAQVALRDSLRTVIDRLAGLERGMLRAMEAGDSAGLAGADQRRTEARSRLDSLLERVVLGTAWGPAELSRLRDRYPGSRVLDTYAARLRLRDGEPEAALELADRLLGREAGDPAVHTLRARALESLDRPEDAWLAYLRAFDLEPTADAPFRGLLDLARREDARPDAMTALLDHVRRQRRLAPGFDALRDREIELLQRMGRLEEARAVQDTTGGGA